MIYKGCQRKMIVVKNTGSELFDEAYFILKENTKESYHENDMLREANRIVNENSFMKGSNKSKLIPTIFFSLGVLVGIGLFSTLGYFNLL